MRSAVCLTGDHTSLCVAAESYAATGNNKTEKRCGRVSTAPLLSAIICMIEFKHKAICLSIVSPAVFLQNGMFPEIAKNRCTGRHIIGEKHKRGEAYRLED